MVFTINLVLRLLEKRLLLVLCFFIGGGEKDLTISFYIEVGEEGLRGRRGECCIIKCEEWGNAKHIIRCEVVGGRLERT